MTDLPRSRRRRGSGAEPRVNDVIGIARKDVTEFGVFGSVEVYLDYIAEWSVGCQTSEASRWTSL